MEALRYRNRVRELLRSEEGYALAVRRMIKPESVFGQLKNNRGFRRFLLRGLSKVTLEVGWLSHAHNLLKQATTDQNENEPVSNNWRLARFFAFKVLKYKKLSQPSKISTF